MVIISALVQRNAMKDAKLKNISQKYRRGQLCRFYVKF